MIDDARPCTLLLLLLMMIMMMMMMIGQAKHRERTTQLLHNVTRL